MTRDFTTGLAGWVVRRRLEGRGRLIYVRDDGTVIDVGPTTDDDLASLAWAWRVARRMTRDRDERSRLARSRDAATRLAVASRSRRA